LVGLRGNMENKENSLGYWKPEGKPKGQPSVVSRKNSKQDFTELDEGRKEHELRKFRDWYYKHVHERWELGRD